MELTVSGGNSHPTDPYSYVSAVKRKCQVPQERVKGHLGYMQNQEKPPEEAPCKLLHSPLMLKMQKQAWR